MDSNLPPARRSCPSKSARFPRWLMVCSSPAARTSSFAWTFESKAPANIGFFWQYTEADVLRSLMVMIKHLFFRKNWTGALLSGLLAMGVGALARGDVPQQKIDGASGWPTWRGASRDNISHETGLLKQWPKDGPPLAWEAKGLGSGYSAISSAEGRIYT